ncbi:hypothetical protein LYSIN_01983 [Lysinibacillus sphaericus]|uniref:Uncharacterized protein n=1 Tax=Lysinibacillus sphaericus TaxID=1421 RepID=A0A2S5D292_LYSSH|nr:hypothetical protein [Lysinibacillus sphaericus]POZ57199.1 hypothetical protein LYSIN_01983 [Lysinibacillus sphaericus]
MEKDNWVEKLSEKVIDANKVDEFMEVQNVVSYVDEIIQSTFNIDELEGKNFGYSKSDKSIQLKFFDKQLSVVAKEFEELVEMKVGSVRNPSDIKVVGVITMFDGNFNYPEGMKKERFNKWHIERILKENFQLREEVFSFE